LTALPGHNHNHTKMKIEIETTAYNERRYGKPYIARVDFTDHKGTPEWGNWIGDPRNGSAGLLTIDAEIGDVLMQGQRDNRNMKKSAPDYFIVIGRYDAADAQSRIESIIAKHRDALAAKNYDWLNAILVAGTTSDEHYQSVIANICGTEWPVRMGAATVRPVDKAAAYRHYQSRA
jgi:hypothetical protein